MKLYKRWYFLLGLFLLLCIGAVYIFIPAQLTVVRSRVLQSNTLGAYRSIGDEAAWKRWWPSDMDGISTVIGEKVYPGVAVELRVGQEKLKSSLIVLTVGLNDSIQLLWKCPVVTGGDPIARIRGYREAKRVGGIIDHILDRLSSFLSKPANIYGMDVKEVRSFDSTLIVSKLLTVAYPTTAELYAVIGSLRAYAASQGAGVMDYPMLNVMRKGDSVESMLALPVDRELKEHRNIFVQRLVPWKVATGEVKGGSGRAEEAMEQLHLYVIDHQLTGMAMAYQQLVTDRSKAPDSSRWVTRVVVPVP